MRRHIEVRKQRFSQRVQHLLLVDLGALPQRHQRVLYAGLDAPLDGLAREALPLLDVVARALPGRQVQPLGERGAVDAAVDGAGEYLGEELAEVPQAVDLVLVEVGEEELGDLVVGEAHQRVRGVDGEVLVAAAVDGVLVEGPAVGGGGVVEGVEVLQGLLVGEHGVEGFAELGPAVAVDEADGFAEELAEEPTDVCCFVFCVVGGVAV